MDLLQSIRGFVEKQCFDSHAKDTNNCLHKSIMSGEVVPTTQYCIQCNTCLMSIIDYEGSGFTLVGGYMQHRTYTPESLMKKSYIKKYKEQGITRSEYLIDGWLFDFEKNTVYGTHFWLEKDGQIFDISSDQFGYDKILIVASDDDRYVKSEKATRNMSDFIDQSIKTGHEWSAKYIELSNRSAAKDCSQLQALNGNEMVM